MSGSGNKIVSHTTIYMFGDILRYSVSLIMLPIYTRFLTTEDYGTIELLTMLIDIASIIFGARVGQSVFRYYFAAGSNHERKSIISSAIIMDFSLNGIGAVAVMVFSNQLAVAIFSDQSYGQYVLLIALSMLMVPLMEIPFTHIRAEQKPWLFFSFSLAKLILQLSLNIYLVVWMVMGVKGVLYSAVISSAVMGVVLSGYSLSRTGLGVHIETCKKLIIFSFPLKLATIGTFYLTFGDRYILNIYRDLSEVGVYALGYKFGIIFTLLAWTPFEKMWESERYAIYNNPDAKQKYQRVFLYISFILALIGLCISVYTKDLLKIMSAPEFWSAYKVVPIIILAYIFQAWAKYCSFGLLLHNRTMQIAYAEMIASGAITIAYFLLIPAYGMLGAAWATIIGFVIRFYWTNRKASQLYDMGLPWVKVALILSLAIMFFLVSLLIPENLLQSIILRTFLIAGFIVLTFSLPILSRPEKREVTGMIRHLIQRRNAD